MQEALIEIAIEIERSLRFWTALKTSTSWTLQAEERLTKKLQAVFDKAATATIRQLSAAGQIPTDPATQVKIWEALNSMHQPFKEAAADAAIEAANQAKREVVDEALSQGARMQFTEMDNITSGYIRGRSFEASEATLARMTGDVKANLAESYNQGLGIDQAAERLKADFENMKGYELERVARTEINSSQNAMRHREMDQQGIAFEQWWGADDDRSRSPDTGSDADHSAGPPGMHGQIVRTGDEFSNGLKYPGDTSGPIEEWINCRCRVVPYFMPEGYGPHFGQLYFYEQDLARLEGEAEPDEIGEVSTDFETDQATLQNNTENAERWLTENTDDLRQMKDNLVRDLDKELSGNPAFKAFAERMHQAGGGMRDYPKDPIKNTISDMVRNWASTSGDNNVNAIAMQQAAAKEFGLGVKGMVHLPKDTARKAAAYLAQNEDALRAMARAQYAITQKELAAGGLKEVILYRGMNTNPAMFKKLTGQAIAEADFNTLFTGTAKMQLQPLSSFSSSGEVASAFASGGGYQTGKVMMVAKVPASKVYSTARTGFGCFSEREFVLLGGKAEKWKTVTTVSGRAMNFEKFSDLAAALKELQIEKLPGDFIVLSPDEDLANADWTKIEWDLGIDSAEELTEWLATQDMTLAEFKKLPVYQHNKESIAWLSEL